MTNELFEKLDYFSTLRFVFREIVAVKDTLMAKPRVTSMAS